MVSLPFSRPCLHESLAGGVAADATHHRHSAILFPTVTRMRLAVAAAAAAEGQNQKGRSHGKLAAGGYPITSTNAGKNKQEEGYIKLIKSRQSSAFVIKDRRKNNVNAGEQML